MLFAMTLAFNGKVKTTDGPKRVAFDLTSEVGLHDQFTVYPFKKLQSSFGYLLRKKWYCNMWSHTGLWNPNYFSISHWRLKTFAIWSSSHEEIRIFVKHVMGPFLHLFVTWIFLIKPFIKGVWNCSLCIMSGSFLSKLGGKGFLTYLTKIPISSWLLNQIRWSFRRG